MNSPHKTVVDDHGSKEKLAAKVLKFVTCPEEEEQEDFEHRIHTMSNRKLLRLWNAQQTLESNHGDRDALVKKITLARFSGGNEAYATKIATYSTPRLLDLGRQHRV